MEKEQLDFIQALSIKNNVSQRFVVTRQDNYIPNLTVNQTFTVKSMLNNIIELVDQNGNILYHTHTVESFYNQYSFQMKI